MKSVGERSVMTSPARRNMYESVVADLSVYLTMNFRLSVLTCF